VDILARVNQDIQALVAGLEYQAILVLEVLALLVILVLLAFLDILALLALEYQVGLDFQDKMAL
jgi:hypothetical protein